MTPDQPGFLKQPNGGCKQPEARPDDSGPLCDRSRSTDRLAMPPSESAVCPPSLIEIVKRDLNQQWEQGRPVSVESYLEALPQLGIADTVSTELILAEYQARIRTGIGADLAQFEVRFPHQATLLRGLIDQQADDPATGSVLGQIDEMMTTPQGSPLSIAPGAKRGIKLPRRFGRFRVLKRLGRGAMGTVYLVDDSQLHRRVALKVPHFRSKYDPTPQDHGDVDRFYREAQAAATLDHPNLCPVYDVGELDGIPYLVMAYIEGRPLSRYINRNRLMTQRRAATVVRKLALALQEAHSKGVVHRDLKPSNIMVNSRRELIIMDFGLVWRIGGQNERITRVGIVLGTPAYMSPEQVSGKAEAIGPWCDIYSLGVIMYELLTGSVPFDGSEGLVLGQILFAEPAPPSSHRPDLDPQIESICLKAMAKSAEQRYATMAELATALGDYLRARSDSSPLLSAPGPVEVVDALARELGEKRVARPAFRRRQAGEGESTSSELSIPSPETMSLPRAWHRWTVVIEDFLLRRSRRYVNRNEYDKLYKILIETCRARAATAQGPDREFYQRLEDLVLPWLTPRALQRSDRDILFSLFCRCREVERELRDRELGGRIDWSLTWRLAALGISVCLVLCVLLYWGWFSY